jgi:4-amino-4-deoxy-L-arabinose transferase-like glycosyltransferase
MNLTATTATATATTLAGATTTRATTKLKRWLAAPARTGLWVFLAALLLYLPCAGSYGLWDPWETHYGEVARQMTVRGDYISLWWPGSPRETPTFQTKPVLSFWLMSLAMKVAGIGSAGGSPDEMALGTRAEWAVRTPFCLLGALGLWAIYLVTSRLAGRRAGVLAALCTGTFPLYALVARQAMTDMAVVGLMNLALALAALALETGDAADQAAPRTASRRAAIATTVLFALATVPQLLIDSIDLRVAVPWRGRSILMYGIVAMAPYWLGTLGIGIYLLRCRRRDVLGLCAAATLAGLAVLAKGLAGLGLPVLILGAHLLVRRSPALWARCKDREVWWGLGACVLIVAAVAVPWHHAMYIRHGAPWWNELYGDNHWKRLMVGRHGDRGTFVYFLRQLGYGVGPWIGLAVASLVAAVLPGLRGTRIASPARPDHDDSMPATDAHADALTRASTDRREAALVLGTVWFVTGYAVVSLSMTKFHHYLVPALPGLGILMGCWLDDLARWRRARAAIAIPAALLAVGLPIVALVTYDLVATQHAAERFLWLFSYDYVYSPAGRPWPATLDFRPMIVAIGAGSVLATAALILRRSRAWGLLGLPGVAVVATLLLLDGFMPKVAPHWSQKGTIARYFQERRSGDEHLVAYQMFWRGENFYTKNAINEGPLEQRTVFDHWNDVDARLQVWLSQHRGQRQFFLFDPAREAHLRALLPAGTAPGFRIIERINNKFVLAVAQL